MRLGAEEFPQSLFYVRPRWNLSNKARETMSLEKPPETTNLQKPRETTSQVLSDCDTWCHRGENLSPPYNMSLKYNLTAVLLVRVYRDDRAGLTGREMLQWLFYLRYAGFDHVFIYDAYVAKSESQYDVLNPLIQSGYVTYIDWSVHNPYTIEGTQIAAYQHCVNKYGKTVRWQMAIDIDEYPFSPIDVEQNFMQRFLKKYTIENPDISQITLANYLFLGKPLDHQTNPLLIDRIRRRTRKRANDLGKSLYKSSHIQSAQVHHNDMRKGRSVDCDPRMLHLNHYWGARLQDWGEDTPKVLKMTEPDFSMKPIIDEINRCSKCLGEDSLYVRRWN